MKEIDLDALVGEKKTIKFAGKVHEIKEISISEYMKYRSAIQSIEFKTDEDARRFYLETTKVFVPTLTEQELDSMTLGQLRALLVFLFSEVSGEEKKTTITK